MAASGDGVVATVAARKTTGDLIDKLVHINRVAKVVKGGRRFGFAALVVIGDGAGQRGFRPWQGA